MACLFFKSDLNEWISCANLVMTGLSSLSFGKLNCSWEVAREISPFCNFFVHVMHCCIHCNFFPVSRSPSLATTARTTDFHDYARKCTRQVIWNIGLEITNTPVFFTVFPSKVWHFSKFAPPLQVNPTIFFRTKTFHQRIHWIINTLAVCNCCGWHSIIEYSTFYTFTMVIGHWKFLFVFSWHPQVGS